MLLALATTLALAAPDLAPAAAPDPVATVAIDTPSRAGQDWWVGLTPPTLGYVGPGFGIGMDVNVRAPSRIAWLQPELDLAYTTDLGGYYFFIFPSGDWHTLRATVGARFGLDHGFYGGIGLGGGVAAVNTDDAGGTQLFPAARLYGGYAIKAGDHMRISPELEIGHLITVALRFEWGG